MRCPHGRLFAGHCEHKQHTKIETGPSTSKTAQSTSSSQQQNTGAQDFISDTSTFLTHARSTPSPQSILTYTTEASLVPFPSLAGLLHVSAPVFAASALASSWRGRTSCFSVVPSFVVRTLELLTYVKERPVVCTDDRP